MFPYTAFPRLHHRPLGHLSINRVICVRRHAPPERGGFEPPIPFGITVFETARFNRSRIFPIFETERSRTSDLQIRNLTLYPTELQSQNQGITLNIRSRGDSNPRNPFGVQLLSREPDSASLAPLQYLRKSFLF